MGTSWELSAGADIAIQHWGRSMGPGYATNMVTKLIEYVEERWYGGQAGAAITFDAAAPESNPLMKGYLRLSAMGAEAAPATFRPRRVVDATEEQSGRLAA